MGRVTETDVGEGNPAGAFDEDTVGAVDHDVGDAVVLEQRLERAKAQHVVHQLARKLALLTAIELDPLIRRDLGEQTLHLDGEPLGRHPGNRCRVEPGQAKLAQFGQWRRRALDLRLCDERCRDSLDSPATE